MRMIPTSLNYQCKKECYLRFGTKVLNSSVVCLTESGRLIINAQEAEQRCGAIPLKFTENTCKCQEFVFSWYASRWSEVCGLLWSCLMGVCDMDVLLCIILQE